MALAITGRIVPLDRADPDAVFRGSVYIDDSGTIEQVSSTGTAPPAGFSGAPAIDVGDAFVLPGLIDLHNHIGYNTLPLWTEPKQKTPFAHHDSWTHAATYQSSISWPAHALARTAPEALLAYVQLRALVGGTTAIQGWPTANREHVQVLRNIDDEGAGTSNHNLIYTSALTKESADLVKMAQAINQGAGFVYHCAEGQVGSLVAREFTDVANTGCLEKTFIGIHCNAIAGSDWQRWVIGNAGAVVWSPFSNLWLYGSTTDIVAARKQGVLVCIGSDWGPSGTKNVQGEIKVAKLVSQKESLGLTDQDLVAMVTINPGDALSRCWKKTIGRLTPGSFGDISVFRDRGDESVWTQIVESTERDVMLVVHDGVPRYGDASLMATPGLGKSSAMMVGGRKRRFVISDPEDLAEVWSWKDIKSRLDAVRMGPVAALKQADRRRQLYTGRMTGADAPLELTLDMPGDGLPLSRALSAEAGKIVIPPLPSLVHDAGFFKSIKGKGFHGGLLDGLAEFYVETVRGRRTRAAAATRRQG
jgi:cytosine/adenosine deaminase-related metal-dependent hydrolase